jgi:hypothetical protein
VLQRTLWESILPPSEDLREKVLAAAASPSALADGRLSVILAHPWRLLSKAILASIVVGGILLCRYLRQDRRHPPRVQPSDWVGRKP